MKTRILAAWLIALAACSNAFVASAALPEQFIGKYAQLEYLRSTSGGNQYLKSGVKLAADSRVKIHFKLNELAANAWASPFGARNGSADQFLVIAGNGIQSSDGWLRRYGSQSVDTANGANKRKPPALGEHTFDLNGNIYDLDGYKTTFTGVTFSGSQEMYVFAANSSGPNQHTAMDCYSLQVWTNGVLVRDYLPCKRLSDQKAGLLDIADHSGETAYEPFYVNAGTGADFTPGPVVVELVVKSIPPQTYDGIHPCCPEVVVCDVEGQELSPSDYEVHYSGNDAIGTDVATATVVGLNDYSGLTAAVRFSIVAAPQGRLTITDLTCPDWAGEPVSPTYSVKLDGAPADPDTYAAVLRNHNAPGVGTLVVTGLTGTVCEGLAAVIGFDIKVVTGKELSIAYIEGDGVSAWYETDFVPNAQTDMIIADAEFLEVGRQSAIWCARGSGNQRAYAFFNTGSGDFMFRCSGETQAALALSGNERCSFVTASNETTYVAGGKTNTLTVAGGSSLTTAGGPLSLLALNEYANGEMTNIGGYGLLRLYSLRIYRNHVLIHNFQPVRDEDGEAALCDTCEPKAKLIRHGTFTAGPACSRAVASEPSPSVYDGEHPCTSAVTARDVTTAKPIDNLADCFDISYADNTAIGWGVMTLTGKAGTPYAGQIDTRYFRIFRAYCATPDATIGGNGDWDSPMTFAEAWTAAAGAADGGEIWLKQGVYTLASSPGRVTPIAEVTIRGGFSGGEMSADAREATGRSVVDGAGEYNALWMHSSSPVLIERVDFTGAKDFVIRKSGSGRLELRQCRIVKNTFSGTKGVSSSGAESSYSNWGVNNFGGEIQQNGGALLAEGCEFGGNALAAGSSYLINGGLIGIANASSAQFQNCLFVSNSVTGGEGQGCILASSGLSNCNFSNCLFKANYSTSSRATLISTFQSGICTIDDCIFSGNFVPGSGANPGRGLVYTWKNGGAGVELGIRRSTFGYNIVSPYIGTVGVAGGRADIVDCVFYGNVRSAVQAAKPGVDVFAESSSTTFGAVTITGSRFAGEGSVYCYHDDNSAYGSLTMVDCTFGRTKFMTPLKEFLSAFGVTEMPTSTSTWPGFEKAASFDCRLKKALVLFLR